MADSSKMINTVVQLGIVAGVVYAVYEWLKTQCSQTGSIMQGTSVCDMLFYSLGLDESGNPVASAPVTSGASTDPAVAAAALLAQQQAAAAVAAKSSGGSGGGGAPTCTPPKTLTAAGLCIDPPPTSQPLTGASVHLSSALQKAAGSNSLNADQWSFYLTQMYGVPLTGEQFTGMFPNRGSTMTADQFVQALWSAGVGSTYGLSGWAFPLGSGGLGIPYEWIHEPWLVNESGGLGDFPDWLKRLLPPPWGTARIFQPKLPPVPPPCLWPNTLNAAGQCVAPPPPPPPPAPPVALQRLFALPDWSPTVFTPVPPPPPPPPVCMWPNTLDSLGRCVAPPPAPPPPPATPLQRLFPLPDWSPRVFTPMPPIQTPLINMGPVDGLVGIPYHMIHDPGVSF
jgi:hypothetical protein